MNPIWQQKQLREYCNAKGIHISAYSPLGANNTKWGDNRVIGCNVLEEIAKSRGKTSAQVNITLEKNSISCPCTFMFFLVKPVYFSFTKSSHKLSN